MTELAEVLELLHRCVDRSCTIVAAYDQFGAKRRDVLVAGATDLRWREVGVSNLVGRSRMRIWAKQPDQFRVEVWRDDALVRLAVADGRHCWRSSEGQIAHETASLSAMPQVTAPPAVVDPGPLIGALRLEVAGHVVRAGRSAILVRGRPRSGSTPSRHEFEVDAKRGILLRRTVWFADTKLYEVVATRVDYDEHIPANVFAGPARDHTQAPV